VASTIMGTSGCGCSCRKLVDRRPIPYRGIGLFGLGSGWAERSVFAVSVFSACLILAFANNSTGARLESGQAFAGGHIMLLNVASGTARRCQARARSTGEQCKKLAVQGCKTCLSHGGHKKVRRGSAHWNYQGAGQTLPERQERRMMSEFFNEVEELMFALGMVPPGSSRTRGRKPRSRTC
jgi:hypothetical protein